jgi:hypothetical protein
MGYKRKDFIFLQSKTRFKFLFLVVIYTSYPSLKGAGGRSFSNLNKTFKYRSHLFLAPPNSPFEGGRGMSFSLFKKLSNIALINFLLSFKSFVQEYIFPSHY